MGREGGEEVLDMAEEWGGVEGLAVAVGGGEGEGEVLAGAGARDVTVEAFVGDAEARVGAEREALLFEGRGFGLGEQGGGWGWGGEEAFVEAEDDGEAEVGVAGAVDGADQDLVEGWGGDADGAGGQAGFEDREPVGEGEGVVFEGEGEIIEPFLHLLPDGEVAAGSEFGVGRGPLLEGGGGIEVGPKLADRMGELGAGGLGLVGLGVRGEGLAEGDEWGDEFAAEAFEWGGVGGGRIEAEGFEPVGAVPTAGEGFVFELVDERVGLMDEAGLEGAEPVVVLPVEGGEAEGGAGEFGEGVMGDGFALVEEEGDLEAGEGASEGNGVGREVANEDGGVAVTAAGAGVVEDEVGGGDGFGFRVAGLDELEAGGGIGEGQVGGPIGFEVGEGGLGWEAVVGGVAGEGFDDQSGLGEAGEALVAGAAGLGDESPGGEPGGRVERRALEAEGEGGVGAVGDERGEEVEFLRGHLGEAIEPEAAEVGLDRIGSPGLPEGFCGEFWEVVGILELMTGEGLAVEVKEEGEVVEFRSEWRGGMGVLGEFGESGRADLVVLEVAEEVAEFLREAWEAGGAVEALEVLVVGGEEGTQDHEAAFFGEEARWGGAEVIEDEVGEAFEGEDLEAGEAVDGVGVSG